MNLRLAGLAALMALVNLAPQAAAQQPAPAARWRVFANGLWSATKLDWDATRTYTEFSEQSSVNSSYTLDGGFGFEAGVRYDFKQHLGAAASVASRSGNASAAFSTGLPHPLFYNRKREVTGTADDLSYKELSEHLGVVLYTSSGKLDLSLTAGVAFFQVEVDQIDLVQYRHDYPYDTATVTGVTRFTAKDSPIGFSIGGSADYRVAEHVAVGIMARYAGATAKLEQADQSNADLTVGGLQVGAGIRFIF